jgi:serine phosphatase RsbU (regulator of sigma subunit)
MKRYWILFVLFVCSTALNAQREGVDSLLNVLKTTKYDTTKISTLAYLSDRYYYMDVDSSILFSRQAISLIKKIENTPRFNDTTFIHRNKASTYINYGAALVSKSMQDSGLYYYEESLKLKEKLNDELGMAVLYVNMGALYKNQGKIDKALENYFKCIGIRERLNDEKGLCRVYVNVAVLFRDQEQIESAMEYNKKSLELSKKINYDAAIPALLNNIGEIFQYTNQFDSALVYYAEGVELARKIGHKYGESTFYLNIGISQRKLRNFNESLTAYLKCLKLRKEINEESNLSNVYGGIATVYFDLKDFKMGIAYADSALYYAKKTGYPLKIKEAADIRYQLAFKLKDYKVALEMLELKVQMSDSILNSENKEKSLRAKIQYDYDKQLLIDSLEYAKAKELHDLQMNEQEAKLLKEKTLRFALYGGLALTLVFSLFIYNRFKVTNQQKKIIEVQKQEVEKQRQEAESQRHIVEEKNKEITDSITYAKRIQEAILPSRYSLTESLKNGFVLFKPKDIVSGDFYWLETYAPPGVGASVSKGGGVDAPKVEASVSEREEGLNKIKVGLHGESLVKTTYFAAADCTGHGVPGAMVSVVCANALSKTLLEENITEPGKILDRTRELVVERFAKSSEDVKDGMDISLVALQQTHNQAHTVQWAGANNPLWIIRKNPEGLAELVEVKPNKQPIGKVDDPQPFNTHTIELQEGDAVYIFTDGYQDQFGGEKGKKFKAAQLKELLLSIQDKTMEEQKKILEKSFEDWKRSLEQIDDVCIIGVRL